MDIVVKGRHTAVPERFRRHVETKLAKLERFDGKVIRVDVELSREHNPRMSHVCERVELTLYTRGPVIRAEAAAADAYVALDGAAGKLSERLRRSADRRASRAHGVTTRNHAVSRAAVSDGGFWPADVTGSVPAPGSGERISAADLAPEPAPDPATVGAATDEAAAVAGDDRGDAAAAAESGVVRDQYDVADRSPMLVRTKTHLAAPMTLDDALSNMELVGHDFYLFQDAASGLPSVVYRRRGYDYGVIHLSHDPAGPADQAGSALPGERVGRFATSSAGVSAV